MRSVKALLYCLIVLLIPSQVWASLSAIGNYHVVSTNYTDGSSDDPIYVFCGGTTSDMGLIASHGFGNFTYEWARYNPSNHSYEYYFTESNVTTSSLINIEEGGYKVKIKDNIGAVVACHRCWVFQSDMEINFDIISSTCTELVMEASYNPRDSFIYYNPPDEPFEIDENTEIYVCIEAHHPRPADLGFVLYGPNNCGNVPVTLHPHLAAIQGCPGLNCPSSVGPEISNLCFSPSFTTNLSICSSGPIVQGDYGWYEDGFCNWAGGTYPLNHFEDLYGCLASDTGWSIQVFDGQSGQQGVLESVQINIANLQADCEPSFVEHISEPLNLSIADFKFDLNTATKYQIPAPKGVLLSYQYGNEASTFININQMYNWSVSNSSVNISNPNQLNISVSNPPQEDTWFYLYVEDHLGCGFLDSILYEAIDKKIDTVLTGNISCYGSNDGTIDINAPWADQYSINNGASWTTNTHFVDLVPGVYQILVEDNGGCVDQKEIEITEPELLVANVLTEEATCYGYCNGKAYVEVSGGTEPYTFHWENLITTLDTNYNLCSGNYNLQVYDSNNCLFNIGYAINEPNPLSFEITFDTATCNPNSGSIFINNISGATPPYSFLWSDGSIENPLADVNSGLYHLTVSDNHGCDSVLNNINLPVFESPTITINLTEDTNVCFGQSIELVSTPIGGTPPYDITWNTGETSLSILTDAENNLCYEVFVKDVHNCISNVPEVCVNHYEAIASTDTVELSVCEGESLNLIVEAFGGHADSTLQYYWNLGSVNSSSINVSPLGEFPDRNDYFAVISDGGCSANDTSYFKVRFYEPPDMDFYSNTQYGCNPLEVSFFKKDDIGFSCIWQMDSLEKINKCNEAEYIFKDPGEFDVKLDVVYGDNCYITNIKENFIKVEESPTAEFSVNPEYPEILDPIVSLTNFSEGDINKIIWEIYHTGQEAPLFIDSTYNLNVDFSNFFKEEGPNFFLYEDQMPYQALLKVVTTKKCSDSILKNIEFTPRYLLTVPNSFTPNGDYKNDSFYPKGIGIQQTENYQFTIFSKWGNKIFESNNANEGWDGTLKNGKKAALDVYIWNIKYKTIEGKQYEQYGYVNLLK